MRIFILDTYYPAFIRAHYAGSHGLAESSYDAQFRSLMGRSFGTSDAYSHHLRELGHEAVEIVANCEPLQLTWAREHGLSTRLLHSMSAAAPGRARALLTRRMLRQIAQAQIEHFDPDIVYVQDLWFFSEPEVVALTRSGRLVVGQIASVAPPDRILRAYRTLISSLPRSVERFRGLGIDAEYLKLAFDERVLGRLPREATRPECDVTFVGGLDPAAHPVRTRLLEHVAPALDLALWGYGIEAVPAEAPHRRLFRGHAWGMEMYEILARSRVTLNGHEDIAEGFANNMRLYEATGVRTLLVTDERRDLSELFEAGREVVTYATPEELIEKVRFYLAHAGERQQIAAAGQARTLTEHTYRQRMPELVALLEVRLS